MHRQFVVSSEPISTESIESVRLGLWWVHLGEDARVDLTSRGAIAGLAADVTNAEPVGMASIEASYDTDGIDGVAELFAGVARFSRVPRECVASHDALDPGSSRESP